MEVAESRPEVYEAPSGLELESTTLLVTRLPENLEEREGHNLFRFFAGYEGCNVSRVTGKPPVLFVHFSDHASAAFARASLFGLKFEPESAMPMKIAFMRSKTNSKRRVPADFLQGGYTKKLKVVDLAQPQGYSAYGYPGYPAYPPAPYGYPPAAYPTAPSVPTAPSDPFQPQAYPSLPGVPAPSPAALPAAFAHTGLPAHFPQSLIPNLPTTPLTPAALSSDRDPTILYVGNLSRGITNEHLSLLFSPFPGFKNLRFNFNKLGHPVCFLDFNDAPSAKAALILDGLLFGENRIRLTYAKKQGDSTATA